MAIGPLTSVIHMMYSDPISPSQVARGRPASGQNVSNPAEEPQVPKESSSSSESLFRTILASCGGFAETAALFLGPSDCDSCVNESLHRSPRSPRSMRRNSSSKTKLKLSQKLKEFHVGKVKWLMFQSNS